VLELTVLTHDARFRAYDVGGESVLLLFRRGATLETVRMPGGTIPPHDGHGPLHLAFAIARDALAQWEERLREYGVPPHRMVAWRTQHLFPRSGRTPGGVGNTRPVGDLLSTGRSQRPYQGASRAICDPSDLHSAKFVVILGKT
jgi:hypothetical protein